MPSSCVHAGWRDTGYYGPASARQSSDDGENYADLAADGFFGPPSVRQSSDGAESYAADLAAVGPPDMRQTCSRTLPERQPWLVLRPFANFLPGRALTLRYVWIETVNAAGTSGEPPPLATAPGAAVPRARCGVVVGLLACASNDAMALPRLLAISRVWSASSVAESGQVGTSGRRSNGRLCRRRAQRVPL